MFNSFGTGPFTYPSVRNDLYFSGGSSLSYDLIASNVTILPGATLVTHGYRIFCNNLRIIGGSIVANGFSATDKHKAAGSSWGTVGGGATGGEKIDLETATAAGSILIGGVGGAGGNGAGSNPGGGGICDLDSNGINVWGQPPSTIPPFHPLLLSEGRFSPAPYFATLPIDPSTESKIYIAAGGAGGGYGSRTVGGEIYGSGGGGGGGGIVFIGCNGHVSLEGTSSYYGIISALGGDGASGQNIDLRPLEGGGTVLGGGGGGGGGGGIIISCNSISLKKATISAAGGAIGPTGYGYAQPGAYGNIIIRTPNGIWTRQTDLSVGPSDSPVVYPIIS